MLFFKKLVADASLYVVVDKSQPSGQGGERDVRESDKWPVRKVIALEGYDLMSMKRSLRVRGACGEMEWTCNVAVVNVTHSSEHIRQINTQAVQCVMPNSTLYDLVRRRSFTLPEVWLMQGYGHPSIPKSGDHPFADLLPNLSRQQQMRLIGMAMHGDAINAWFLFNILTTNKDALRLNMAQDV
jgi:hypothetical protein